MVSKDAAITEASVRKHLIAQNARQQHQLSPLQEESALLKLMDDIPPWELQPRAISLLIPETEQFGRAARF